MSINSRNGNTLLESGMYAPVRAATTAAITLDSLQTIDGVVLIEGDRVLVKDQADQTTNGIYAASSGDWVRTSDASGNTQFFAGMAVNVAAGGTVNGGLAFLCTCTDDPVVIDTSLLTFASQVAVATATQRATSITSAALTLGAKVFATQAGKAFAAKQWVLIYETSNSDNRLLAEIASYVGAALSVNVVSIDGAGGPFIDWTIVLANSAAAAGLVPPVGNGNTTGPAGAVAGNLVKFADNTGKVLADTGVVAGALAGRNTLQAGDAGTASIQAAALQVGAAPLPYVAALPTDNLKISNDLTNPNTDITVSPGRVRDFADTTNLQLAGTMLKRLDATWAGGGSAGNRVGCMEVGSALVASKTYHVYLIGKLGQAVTSRSRTGNVATLTIAGHGLGVGGTFRAQGVGSGYDGVGPITAATADTISYANTGADEGATAATGTVDGFDLLASQQDKNAYPGPAMPAGWTVKQCLGSVLSDGSANIFAEYRIGDEVWWVTPEATLTAATINAVETVIALRVPIGVAGMGAFVNSVGSGIIAVYLENSFLTAQVASLSTAPLGQGGEGVPTQAFVRTNASGQITAHSSSNGTPFALATLGYRDPRRRLF